MWWVARRNAMKREWFKTQRTCCFAQQWTEVWPGMPRSTSDALCDSSHDHSSLSLGFPECKASSSIAQFRDCSSCLHLGKCCRRGLQSRNKRRSTCYVVDVMHDEENEWVYYIRRENALLKKSLYSFSLRSRTNLQSYNLSTKLLCRFVLDLS